MSKQTALSTGSGQAAARRGEFAAGDRRRRSPQRTCVACRTTTAKRELVRLVCTTGGRVEVDPTGKKAGRGAYLCRRPECWQEALGKDRLSHALRTKLAEADRETLRAQGQALLDPAAGP